MNKDYSLLVSSCDSYSETWNPFFYLLKKHWPDIDCSIHLCTESKKFSFDGLKIECPLNFVNNETTWSENLIATIMNIKTEHVLLILDDFWLKSAVDTSILNQCMEYMINDKNIGYICLAPNQPGPNYNSKYPELEYRSSKANYRINAQAGLWRKDFLLKILRKHESAWVFEWQGTRRSNLFYKEKIYVIKNSINRPFDYPPGGVLFRGKYIKSHLKFYDEFNIDIDTSRGIEELDNLRLKYSNIKVNRFNISYWIDLLKSLTYKW